MSSENKESLPLEIILVGLDTHPRYRPIIRLLAENDITVSHKTARDTIRLDPAEVPAGVLILEEPGYPAFETLVAVRKRLRGAGVPVFVACADTDVSRSRYIAAGATDICLGDDRDEHLLAEILSYVDVDLEALKDVRVDLLQPFVTAAIEAMNITANVKARIVAIKRKQDARVLGDVSSLIDLFGTSERLLAVSMPMATACWMTSNVLGDLVDEPDADMVYDCLGELSNIIAGQVKGYFVHSDDEFDISTPSIVVGDRHEIYYRNDLPSFVMEFESDVGPFVLQLCVRDRGRIFLP